MSVAVEQTVTSKYVYSMRAHDFVTSRRNVLIFNSHPSSRELELCFVKQEPECVKAAGSSDDVGTTVDSSDLAGEDRG